MIIGPLPISKAGFPGVNEYSRSVTCWAEIKPGIERKIRIKMAVDDIFISCKD
jgi:hypothetical protein